MSSPSEDLRRSIDEIIGRSHHLREQGASLRQRAILLEDTLAASPPGPGSREERGGELRVLIVEDDPNVRAGLESLLSRERVAFLSAGSVAEAASALGVWRPTCILLDLMLPGASGVALLEQLRAQGLVVRVAVVTATQDGTLLEAASRLAPGRVFHKPVDVPTLLGWIREGEAEPS